MHGSSSLPSTRRCRRGFTLIEVLVTVVILSIGIVLVLRAFETSLVALGQARDALRAGHLIRGKMAEAEADALEGGRPAYGAGGRLEAPFSEYRWELRSGGPSGTGTGVAAVVVDVWRAGWDVRYTGATLVRR